MRLSGDPGCDLVEVSAHSGARPEHATWQGKIFSRSGTHPKYPNFRAATGYGRVDGLCGANCRHTFGPYIEGSPPVWSEEELAKLDEAKYEYNGKKLTEYEAQQQQRYNERQIRRWKREYTAMEAAGLDSSEAAGYLRIWENRQKDFLQRTDLYRQQSRESIAGFSRSQANNASAIGDLIEEKANALFSLNSAEENIHMYLREKSIIDTLEEHGVKYIQRISGAEIIIDAGKPKISRMRQHAIENLLTRPDRNNMTIERAQEIVDNAMLTLYQIDRENIKFLAQEGYAILNLRNELVTAVPQRWRKKYNKYIGGDNS